MIKNSNFNEAIGNVIKFCMTEIMSTQSVNKIMEKSKLIDLALDQAKEEGKNIVNLNLEQQKTEINPKRIVDFSQRKGSAKNKIGEKIIAKIIEEIPSKYSDFGLGDFEEGDKSLMRYLQKPESIPSDVVKQSLEKFFQDLENPFVDITIDTLNVLTKNNAPQIESCCQFKIKEDAKQPVAIISMTPPLGQNPLMKIKFKIEGNIIFPNMKITDLQNFNITLGEFDATLAIAIQEIKAIGMGLARHDEDAIYRISEKNIKYRLPDKEIKEKS